MLFGWLGMIWFACALASSSIHSQAAADVLIVADEFPAMQILAGRLQRERGVSSQIVAQGDMPKELGNFRAVIVYIHRDLDAAAERAFIDYAQGGGRLVLLHHSISSGKRKNHDWFEFLAVKLPEGSLEAGGYKWTEAVKVQWVALASTYVMTNGVSYPEQIRYRQEHATATNGERELPGFTLDGTEVYLNHVLEGPRTLLMGLKYTDLKTGKLWMQETAGWFKKAGKGTVLYFMPGHRVEDFEDPSYGRIVVNAVTASAAHLPEAEEASAGQDTR
jgi:hypothetical protein